MHRYGPPSAGFIPRQLTSSAPRIQLAPKNFGDQYAVNDWSPIVPESFAHKTSEWTLDLAKPEPGFAPYHTNIKSPSPLELYWNPGAISAPRQGMTQSLKR